MNPKPHGKKKITLLTTMAIATIIATPSTQSTGGSSGSRAGPKSWNNPNAKEMTAAIDSRIYGQVNYAGPEGKTAKESLTKTLSFNAAHMSCKSVFAMRTGKTFSP